MNYDAIRDELRTGDIVLYSGSAAISTVIKLATSNRWSHVGMVVYLPDCRLVSVWESTKQGTRLRDLDSGQVRKGVQLVPLSDRLITYRGSVAVRRLQDADLQEGVYSRLWRLREDLRTRPYEKDKIELLKAAYDGPFGRNEEDLSSVFCSELVAEAYQALGLLGSRRPSNEYVPADFSSSRQLPLKKGTLGREIPLTMVY